MSASALMLERKVKGMAGKLIGRARSERAFFDDPRLFERMKAMNGGRAVMYGQITFRKVKGGVRGYYHRDVQLKARPRLSR